MAEGLIPFSRVIERVRKLANDYPERVAECEYFNNMGEPQCIWGHVFADLGCAIEWQKGSRTCWVVAPNGEMVTDAGSSIQYFRPNWGQLGIEGPNSVQLEWSCRVQGNQDREIAWGFAVGSVDEYFKRRGITV